jgi:hypothetical protein
VRRLEGVAGVVMQAGGHAARVDDIVRLRNRAIHFTTVGLVPAGLQEPLARALDFVLWFLNTQFRDQGDQDTQELVEESIEDLTTQVGHLKDLVDERMASIMAELDATELCVECPRCRQATLMMIGGDVSRCAFCLWKPADGGECAAEYVDTVLGKSHYTTIKDGGDWPVFVCTACSEVSLVEGIEQLLPDPVTMNRGEPPCDWKAPAYWACFSCGTTADRTELDRCARCDALTDTGHDDGLPVYSDCWADVLRD